MCFTHLKWITLPTTFQQCCYTTLTSPKKSSNERRCRSTDSIQEMLKWWPPLLGRFPPWHLHLVYVVYAGNIGFGPCGPPAAHRSPWKIRSLLLVTWDETPEAKVETTCASTPLTMDVEMTQKKVLIQFIFQQLQRVVDLTRLS